MSYQTPQRDSNRRGGLDFLNRPTANGDTNRSRSNYLPGQAGVYSTYGRGYQAGHQVAKVKKNLYDT